jgi:hypothetical protein
MADCGPRGDHLAAAEAPRRTRTDAAAGMCAVSN